MKINTSNIQNLRRRLHAHPDLSGDEAATAARIKEFLQPLNPTAIATEIGGAGMVVTFDSGKPGPVVLFRAELDALPIQEINEFEHRSVKHETGHKCGHDGHMAILCGLAEQLQQQGVPHGKVLLLFQPAEETGEGAQAVLADENFKAFQPDFVYSLHNLPGYPAGAVVVRDHSFTAAVTSLVLRLTGKTSHAAEPEHGHNPALAVADILQQSLALDNNNPEKEDFAVVTPVHVLLGSKAYGTSAGYAEVHFTLRCWTNKHLEQLQNNILQLSEKTAKKHHLRLEHNFTQTFYANQNNAEAVELVRKAARANEIQLLEREYPFKWGEDFGLFTSRYKGCMFGLGAGENCPALHNPDYDFPDEILENGVKMFYEVLRQTWKHK